MLVTGYDLGVAHDGGYAERVRVPGDWVVPLPAGLTLFDAMAIGTAGFTAALSVVDMERNGLTPAGGPVICHNDVCLENVVFRNGKAVALLDFDFAAPGRPLFDLAQLLRMCVPLDADQNTARLGWTPADRIERVRLGADAYGLSAPERGELLTVLEVSMERGESFVQRRVESGNMDFIAMFEMMGRQARVDLRRTWFAERRQDPGRRARRAG